MNKARVLIADDSFVIRRLLANALAAEPSIEVVGMAANGRIALEKIEQLKPDLITLDIEMPEMDGLEALKAIRQRYPQLPVVMFSTLTDRAVINTVKALSHGAADYVTKPASATSIAAALQTVRDELLPKIKALCPWIDSRSATNPKVVLSSPTTMAKAEQSPTRFSDIVVIGSSTGGPNALAQIFAELPSGFSTPVAVVQHMPPVFTKYLADRLNNRSPAPVREATDGELVRSGAAWLAPGGYHMTLARGAKGIVTRLNQDPPENSCRPAVDVLFRSVAQTHGSNALAVVLTGMGQDGLEGCRAIRAAGGRVIVQDEASSVVWGMPGAVVRADLAHEVLPLSQIAARIAQLVRVKNPHLATV